MYLCEIEMLEIEWFICIKMDLALNNLQSLICHKTKSKCLKWPEKGWYAIKQKQESNQPTDKVLYMGQIELFDI